MRYFFGSGGLAIRGGLKSVCRAFYPLGSFVAPKKIALFFNAFDFIEEI